MLKNPTPPYPHSSGLEWQADSSILHIFDHGRPVMSISLAEVDCYRQRPCSTTEHRQAQQDEISAAHELLSRHCVATTNQGAPMSLMERIDELYSWYASIVHGGACDPEEPTSIEDDPEFKRIGDRLLQCSTHGARVQAYRDLVKCADRYAKSQT